MFDNPVLAAAITYGLTLIIALIVGGVISFIRWAVAAGEQEASGEKK